MCWYCGSPITEEEPIGRSLRCLSCGKDLRVCMNCRFYLPSSAGSTRGDCAESHAESGAGGALERDRANFCDWFSLNQKFRSAGAGQQKERNEAASAKSAFDNLFK